MRLWLGRSPNLEPQKEVAGKKLKDKGRARFWKGPVLAVSGVATGPRRLRGAMRCLQTFVGGHIQETATFSQAMERFNPRL